jgi:hypothetical protein
MFICTVALLLFAYVALRAARLPITWDEAYNYLEFTRQGVLWPTRLRAMSANNHYLTTWLSLLTTTAFGVSALALRLPTLAAYVLFLYYTARLAAELPSPALRGSAFLVLNLNPYLLDFFSLARGYGIAYGLLAGSVWHLWRYFTVEGRSRHADASLALAALAVSAHLTMIHFLLLLAVVVGVQSTLRTPSGWSLSRRLGYSARAHAPGWIAVVLVATPALLVIRQLRDADAFFYGGTTGFWHDTVVGVMRASLYQRPYADRTIEGTLPLSALLGAVVLVVTGLALCRAVQALKSGVAPRVRALAALAALVTGCAVGSIAQHYLLDVRYLTDRTALYLLLLTMFVAVLLADEAARKGSRSRYALPMLAALMTVHLFGSLNVTHVLEWKVESDVRRALADVARRRDPGQRARPVILGPTLELEAPINFYRLVDTLRWLAPADRRRRTLPLNDFYLYTVPEWRSADTAAFELLERYETSETVLLRPRARPVGFATVLERTLDFEGDAEPGTERGAVSTEVAYSGVTSGVTDQRCRQSGTVRITPRFDVAEPARGLAYAEAAVWMSSLANATARLEVAFERGGVPYLTQRLVLQDVVPRARGWVRVRLPAFVPPEVRPGDRVSAYVWNRRDRVYVDDLTLRWLRPIEGRTLASRDSSTQVPRSP